MLGHFSLSCLSLLSVAFVLASAGVLHSTFPTGSVAAGGTACPVLTAQITGFQTVFPSCTMTYKDLGTGAATYASKLADGAVKFVATDMALSSVQLTTIQKAYPGKSVLHVPHVVDGVVIAFNFPSYNGVVKFDAPTLAKIYLGTITKWNDADIVAMNPDLVSSGLDMNQIIKPVGRSDAAFSTYEFTQYLTTFASTEYTAVASTTISWPTAVTAMPGADNAAQHVLNTAYSIGYMGKQVAATKACKTASLKNKSGAYIAPTDASLALSVTSSTMPASTATTWNTVYLGSLATDAGAYPATHLTFLVVVQSTESTDAAACLYKFLLYANSEAGQLVFPANYGKLPEVVKRGNNVNLINYLAVPTVKETPTTFNGGGSSYPEPPISALLPLFTQYGNPFCSATFTKASSDSHLSAVAFVANGDYSFLGTDMTLSVDEEATIKSATGQNVFYVPHCLTGISIGYNFPGYTGAALRFDAKVIAKIYKRTITKWNDAAILALNPGLQSSGLDLNKDIIPVGRSEACSTTYEFLQYLDKFAPEEWTTGPALLAQWATGIVQSFHGGPTAQLIATTDYAFGYGKKKTMQSKGAVCAEIKNKAGNFVYPNDANMQKAATGVTFPAFGDRVGWNLLNMSQVTTDPNAYPLTYVSFLVVPARQRTADKHTCMEQFLEYANTMQAGLKLAANFVPLPEVMMTNNLKGLSDMAPYAVSSAHSVVISAASLVITAFVTLFVV